MIRAIVRVDMDMVIDSRLGELSREFPDFTEESLKLCIESPLFQLMENGNPRPQNVETIKQEG